MDPALIISKEVNYSLIPWKSLPEGSGSRAATSLPGWLSCRLHTQAALLLNNMAPASCLSAPRCSCHHGSQWKQTGSHLIKDCLLRSDQGVEASNVPEKMCCFLSIYSASFKQATHIDPRVGIYACLSWRSRNSCGGCTCSTSWFPHPQRGKILI